MRTPVPARGRSPALLRGLILVALATMGCGVLASGGCRRLPPPLAGKPADPLLEIETRLFLIGDAGNPAPRDPVLVALGREVAEDPARSLVVYLGDNIYPRGLPPDGDPGRKEAERRLDAQLDVARPHLARAIFIPGNHDWNAYSAGGWTAVRRQGEYIKQNGGTTIALLPENGCPGPVVRDVEERLRLVLLDTQWWLHDADKPEHPTSDCPQDSETEVLDAVAAAIQDAGDRRVVVAGHHPLATGGIHGGYFGWRDHIFPLRARKSWLWVPLPGVGSAYPAARRRGISNQDLSGLLNRKMREGLEGVFSKHAPHVYAAGHEHNLQVLQGKDVKYLVVSGAGYYDHITRAEWTKETLFAREASGYVRLDVGKDGSLRLAVRTVDATGRATEAYAKRLE